VFNRPAFAWLKQPATWVALAAVALGVGTAVYVVVISGQRQLSQLEFALFQIIEVALALVGAFFVGQRSAGAAAADVVRPHARSAFRRLTSLYEGLGRLRSSIDDRRAFLDGVANKSKSTVDMAYVQTQLDILSVQVIAELATANDAMEDWRDLVPDEVERLERAAESRVGISPLLSPFRPAYKPISFENPDVGFEDEGIRIHIPRPADKGDAGT